MGRLNETIDKNGGEASTVDLLQWLNFTTFDIIGDLGWGAAFGCLKDTTYHPWIKVVLHFKAVLLATSLKYYPLLEAIIMAITPKSAMADLQQVLATTHNKVKDRLAHAEPEHRYGHSRGPIKSTTQDSADTRMAGINQSTVAVDCLSPDFCIYICHSIRCFYCPFVQYWQDCKCGNIGCKSTALSLTLFFEQLRKLCPIIS
jgi:hypothetical protein